MTITTDKINFSDGHRAAIAWNKAGYYEALLYRDNGSGILQNSDIELSRNYPTRQAARRAIMRKAKALDLAPISNK